MTSWICVPLAVEDLVELCAAQFLDEADMTGLIFSRRPMAPALALPEARRQRTLPPKSPAGALRWSPPGMWKGCKSPWNDGRTVPRLRQRSRTYLSGTSFSRNTPKLGGSRRS